MQPDDQKLSFDTSSLFLTHTCRLVGAGVCAPCPSRPKDGGGEFPVQTRATGLVLINIFNVTNLCLSLSHCVQISNDISSVLLGFWDNF